MINFDKLEKDLFMENLNYIILFLIFAIFPLIAGGIIRKVRARAQGRKGPPLLQNFL